MISRPILLWIIGAPAVASTLIALTVMLGICWRMGGGCRLSGAVVAGMW